jgi:hypothetical protein
MKLYHFLDAVEDKAGAYGGAKLEESPQTKCQMDVTKFRLVLSEAGFALVWCSANTLGKMLGRICVRSASRLASAKRSFATEAVVARYKEHGRPENVLQCVPLALRECDV